MKGYIGVKMINAKKMTRSDYLAYRGWPLPEGEDGNDAGYLVEYLNGGKPNTSDYSGYVSWSPEDVFEESYRRASAMTFGLAVEVMKDGYKVARQGWNGKGMWLTLVQPPQSATTEQPMHEIDGISERLLPFIGMKTADSGFVPWLASQTDILSDDWTVLAD